MKKTAWERFSAKFTVSESGCWLWHGAIGPTGYGSFRDNNRTIVAHRFAYLHLKGSIPEGLELDHLCRVRNCVNPDHLEAVSKKENCLRGMSFAAENARKTYCKNGHEFTPENTLIRENSRRRCKACHAVSTAKWGAKNRNPDTLVQNARKTHCNNGHELIGDNLIITKKGWRNCRICINALKRKYRREKCIK